MRLSQTKQHYVSTLLFIKTVFVDLFRFSPKNTLSNLMLITLKGLSSGISLLMVLPLFSLLGLSNSTKTQHVSWLDNVFYYLHIPKTLPVMLGIVVLTMSLVAYINYLEQQASTRLQQRYNQYLRSHLYQTLLFSQWSFLRSQKKSDLIHTMISETQQFAISNHQLLLLINQIFLIVTNGLIALYLSWATTLFAMAAAMILFVWMTPTHQKTLKTGAHHLKLNQDLQQIINQQLDSIKTIKGSGLESAAIQDFAQKGEALAQSSTQFNLHMAKSRLHYGICSASICCFLLYVAIAIVKLPLAQLITLLLVYMRILPLISSIQQAYQRILHQLPAHQHILQLLTQAQHHQEPTTALEPLHFAQHIHFEQVSFRYPKSEQFILHQVHFTIKKNSTTLILGPSGIGKTTLVDLVCGLHSPVSGQILIDNQILNKQNAAIWRRQIAYITQDVFLFNGTVRDNLLWFCQHTTVKPLESDITTALKLSAAEFVYELPQGLETLIGEKGVTLSGGERQRLALARAILQKPDLLILDESTNSLDAAKTRQIQHTLATLKGQMTILIISHQVVDLATIDLIIDLSKKSTSTPKKNHAIDTFISTDAGAYQDLI